MDEKALQPLTDITPQNAETAYRLEAQVKVIKSNMQGSFFALGKILKEIRDNNYHQALGYASITEWLSSPDIAISRRWAASAINVYELYIVQLGKPIEEVKEIDYTKLVSIAPIIKKHPEEAQEWFDKASSLRRIDLQSEIKTKKISDRVERMEKFQDLKPQDNIIHGDLLEEVKKLADHSIDAVITAPPQETLPFVYQELFSELRRVLKPKGSIFVFADFHTLLSLSNALLINDYHLMRDIILSYTNASKNTGIASLMPYHETVLWATRSETPVYNFTDIERDIWAMKPVDEPEVLTEKPADILIKLIKMATDEQQTILDPFAGSGNIVLAGKTLNRNVVAIEQDELWYNLILEKLQK